MKLTISGQWTVQKITEEVHLVPIMITRVENWDLAGNDRHHLGEKLRHPAHPAPYH